MALPVLGLAQPRPHRLPVRGPRSHVPQVLQLRPRRIRHLQQLHGREESENPPDGVSATVADGSLCLSDCVGSLEALHIRHCRPGQGAERSPVHEGLPVLLGEMVPAGDRPEGIRELRL